MNCFRYKLDHDYGFAPNPFHGLLTLATCKGGIRRNKNLQIGDWIIGLGSVSMNNLHHLIYAMKVEEILSFDQYWNDPRFECKKPVLKGSLLQMYGDNVYHTDSCSGKVIQENCAHSKKDGRPNIGHYKRDIDGKYVLISSNFYYFGDNAPLIPAQFNYIYKVYRSFSYRDLMNQDEKIQDFINWLTSTFEVGIHGDPCNWKEHNLPEMDIYEE